MPIVRSYPLGEVSPQPLPDVVPNVPAGGDAALFGAGRARDLQVAGQALGQAGNSLAALYERTAREANETRVQDLNNQFLDGRRAILQTYYDQTGADAITGADAATGKLTALRDEVFDQAANPWQRRRLGRILDTHLADSRDGITRHVVAQQDVYGRDVATRSLETARTQAIADPALLPNAVHRAEYAARVLHAGQPPEAIEAGVRAARGSVVAGVIGDRLAQNDPLGVDLFRQHADRLDPADRRTLGAAAEMLSTTLDADAWLRERRATLRPTAPTGDASAPSAEPSLPDQDGIIGTRQRLDEIEQCRRALTALNEQAFAADPTRLRANQRAIDTDTARRRAAVKADSDGLYADLRRHLTSGGPDGGPAVTLPPSLVMSRLTEPRQDAVIAQVTAAIAGRKPATDPQTWYAIRQGLTGDDAGERRRWASTNLVPFMGRLSDEDYAALEKLQSVVRNDDGGAGQSRLQIVNLMANHALRSLGIDPTPQPDAPPGSDAAKAARFHRTLQDDLSAIESGGHKPTDAETYAIVTGLKNTGIKSGWLKVSDPGTSPGVLSNIPPTDDAVPTDDVVLAQAGSKNDTFSKPDDEPTRMPDAAGRGHGMAPATDLDQGGTDYQAAQTEAERSERRSGLAPLTEPPSNDPEFVKASKARPGVPVVLPNGEHIEDPKSPTHYVMAPFLRLESVVEAARRARSEIQAVRTTSPTLTPLIAAAKLYDALHRNVDHGGDFDYQRQPSKNKKGGFVQLPQFRNISNVNVGLFCQQLGLPRATALIVSGVFALAFSSNSSVFNPYFLDEDTKKYIDIGYDLGEKGVFD